MIEWTDVEGLEWVDTEQEWDDTPGSGGGNIITPYYYEMLMQGEQ